MNVEEYKNKNKLCNYTELENVFQEAKLCLVSLKGKVAFEEIKDKFPIIMDKNKISILFPTFKIWVLDKSILYEDVMEMLAGIKNIRIDIETDVIKWPNNEQLFPLTIHCEDEDLGSNSLLADKIMNILKKQDIECERSIDTGSYVVYVTVDEKGYITKVMKN